MGYVLRLCSNASVSKLLLELLLLHVLLPAFLQHGLYCQCVRWLVSAWTLTATHMLYAGHTHSDTRGGEKNQYSHYYIFNVSIYGLLFLNRQTNYQILIERRLKYCLVFY